MLHTAYEAALDGDSIFGDSFRKLRHIGARDNLIGTILKAKRPGFIGSRDGGVKGPILGDETGSLGIERGIKKTARKNFFADTSIRTL